MTTLLLLAFALSMDAFAAAVGYGARLRTSPITGEALRVGVAFGCAQGMMPLLGWGLGVAFMSIIRDVDHWIAFALLAAIGGHMVVEGLRRDDDTASAKTGLWAVLTAALATSIDAAAAGITLPMLELPVLIACTVIGIVTLILSTAGVYIGTVAGGLIGRKAEVLGGFVLIGIGAKILIEHLYFPA